MNTTRVGKIGRLPKAVRDVLGDRLEAGEPGGVLVEWLNGLTSVQEVLGDYFGGRPISEQNLSEWRQGGHEEWLRHESARVLAQDLAAQSKDLILAANGKDVSEFLARRLSLIIVRLSQVLLDQEADPAKQWEQVCKINRELSRLRRDDHRAAQLALDRRRLDLLAKESGREMQEAALGRFSPAQSRDELWSLESDAQERREEMREAESCPNQSPTSRETSNLKGQKEQPPAAGQTAAADEIAGKKETKATQPNPSVSDLSAQAARESSKNQNPPSNGLRPASAGPGETSISQPQVEALECSAEVDKSGRIQVNPSKSDLSNTAAADGGKAKLQTSDVTEADGGFAGHGANNGESNPVKPSKTTFTENEGSAHPLPPATEVLKEKSVAEAAARQKPGATELPEPKSVKAHERSFLAADCPALLSAATANHLPPTETRNGKIARFAKAVEARGFGLGQGSGVWRRRDHAPERGVNRESRK